MDEVNPASPRTRSKRVYAYWAIAFALLLALGMFCWLVVVPVMQVRGVLGGGRHAADVMYYGPEEVAEAVKRLGGPGRAADKLGDYLLLPAAVAPAKRNAGSLLVHCGPPARDALIRIMRSNDADAQLPVLEAMRSFAQSSALAGPPGEIALLIRDSDILAVLAESMHGWPAETSDEMSEPEMEARSDNGSRLSDASMVILCAGAAARPALPFLIENLSHPDGRVRHYSARAMLSIGPLPPSAARGLMAMLRAKGRSDRSMAAELLGKVHPPPGDAAVHLQKLLKDEGSGVRQAAAEALKKIRGDRK